MYAEIWGRQRLEDIEVLSHQLKFDREPYNEHKQSSESLELHMRERVLSFHLIDHYFLIKLCMLILVTGTSTSPFGVVTLSHSDIGDRIRVTFPSRGSQFTMLASRGYSMRKTKQNKTAR